MGEKISYNQAREELERILENLERESLDVDELTRMVKRAMELIRFCKEKISHTEMEVNKIVKEFEEEVSSEKEDKEER
ncbi:MAG: exodeoxyribonuclease VII small subunit [Candidatus Omnitrophota bacterium]|nr:MAG: exodeoxyribonuclease VII small subunit [Candidatus Omnitrophota bacterium]